MTPVVWQACLAFVFLFTLISWIWFAFIKPSKFSRFTSRKYAQVIYHHILRGNKSDLIIVADEISRSSKALIEYSPDLKVIIFSNANKKDVVKFSNTQNYVNDIFHMISDKRFCNAIVGSSPVLALTLFRELSQVENKKVALDIFAKNIFVEALLNKESFLYHESRYHESGFMGHVKPISNAIFSNSAIIEDMPYIFDLGHEVTGSWTVVEYDAYLRAFTLCLSDYIRRGIDNRPFFIENVFEKISSDSLSLYKLKDSKNILQQDEIKRLTKTVDFLVSTFNLLDTLEKPFYYETKKSDAAFVSIYDTIAVAMVEVVSNASIIDAPKLDSWFVNHNIVFSKIFNSFSKGSKAEAIVLGKLRRLLYDSIKNLETMDNYKSAGVLSVLINILVFNHDYYEKKRKVKPLSLAVSKWVRLNFNSLYLRNSQLALACLVDSISYDQENNRIIKTVRASISGKGVRCIFFDLM